MNPSRLFKKLRTDAGWTQTQVATALGFAGKNTVYLKESGRRNVRVRDLLALASVTNRELRMTTKGEWTV